MSTWDSYPADYRTKEVHSILAAVRAGECLAIVGLSGAGKSNLLGFLVNRANPEGDLVLVDCNRLVEGTPAGFFRLVRSSLGDSQMAPDELAALERTVEQRLQAAPHRLCLLFDRFDALSPSLLLPLSNSLRSLRDTHKYQLTYGIATRRPLDPQSELAELFFAHTLWLGPLSPGDARWSADQYAQRQGIAWDEKVLQKLVELSWGYPSLLRAACEAVADGAPLEVPALLSHSAVQQRMNEFWADLPSPEDLKRSGLEGHPMLLQKRPASFDLSDLTAKEALLMKYFLAHPNQLCEKDDLIRAVWPEDRIYEGGIRDDSLAQLVRRLRRKIEVNPANPVFIENAPGRGYLFHAPGI